MKQIISISRRTDVIAFYSRWLKEVLEAGEMTIRPPRGVARTLSLHPEDIHTLVFWSKNYKPLLEDRHLQAILSRYDSVYFQFSITGLGGTRIERRVPPPGETIQEVREMAKIWGPERINWRFDPIIHWLDGQGQVKSNVPMFNGIASGVSEVGIRRCTFSFAQWYGKIPAQATKSGIKWIDSDDRTKGEELRQIIDVANRLNLALYSCAQDRWAEVTGVNKGSCIDGALLSALHPHKTEALKTKDQGQRPECGCTTSVDVGSYTQKCPHGCIYCYASPLLVETPANGS